MKKRFIVSINDSTKEQEQLFLTFIKDNNLSWWHWINNTWLLIDFSGKLNASDIRNSAVEIFVNERILVISINNGNGSWAGFGPKTEEKNMFNWIKENWEKD